MPPRFSISLPLGLVGFLGGIDVDHVTKVVGRLAVVALLASLAAALVVFSGPSASALEGYPCPPGGVGTICSPSGWATLIQAGEVTAAQAAAAGGTVTADLVAVGLVAPTATGIGLGSAVVTGTAAVAVGFGGTSLIDGLTVDTSNTGLDVQFGLPGGWKDYVYTFNDLPVTVGEEPIWNTTGTTFTFGQAVCSGSYSSCFSTFGTWAIYATIKNGAGAAVGGSGRQPFSTLFSSAVGGDWSKPVPASVTKVFGVPYDGSVRLDLEHPHGTVVASVTWYGPGVVDRPQPTESGLVGQMISTAQCVDASGAITTVQTITSVSAGLGVIPVAVEPVNCPPGSVLGAWSVDWVTASGTQNVYDYVAPEWITDMPVEFPGCVDGGCDVELWRLFAGAPSASCGVAAVGCPEWWSDAAKADHYECRYGPYPAPLGLCGIFRKPGFVSPNATQVVQPDGTVTGSPQPIISTNPADYQQVDALPKPPPAPVVTPVPVVVGNPDPLPSLDSSACFPSGWGVFNPLEWVYRPVVCALTWAFVPREAVVRAELERGADGLAENGVLAVFPAVASVPGDVASGWSGGCSGGLTAFEVSTSAGDLSAEFPCAPGEVFPSIATQYGWFYNLVVVLLVVGTGWGVYITARAYFGGKGD